MLADEADLVLVLGSQNSSNSQRLAELARERGVPAYLIDGPGDIEPEWFDGVEDGAGHGRRECAGSRRRRVPRLAPRPVRRDGRAAVDSARRTCRFRCRASCAASAATVVADSQSPV